MNCYGKIIIVPSIIGICLFADYSCSYKPTQPEMVPFQFLGVQDSLFYYEGIPFSGVTKIYDSLDRINRIGNINSGLPHGEWKEFYPDGLLKSVVTYHNGKKTGAYRSYYENGRITVKGAYINGNPHGNWEFFYDNGEMLAYGTYENGLAVGIRKEFDMDGNLWAIRHFKEGVQISCTGNCDEEGEIQNE